MLPETLLRQSFREVFNKYPIHFYHAIFVRLQKRKLLQTQKDVPYTFTA